MEELKRTSELILALEFTLMGPKQCYNNTGLCNRGYNFYCSRGVPFMTDRTVAVRGRNQGSDAAYPHVVQITSSNGDGTINLEAGQLYLRQGDDEEEETLYLRGCMNSEVQRLIDLYGVPIEKGWLLHVRNVCKYK